MAMRQLMPIVVTFLALLLQQTNPPVVAAELTVWRLKCDNITGNYTVNSPYKNNLGSLLSRVTKTNINYGFYNLSSGESPDVVNLISLCQGDVDVSTCHTCQMAVIDKLKTMCPNQKTAIAWADDCMVRYSSEPMFRVLEESPFFVMHSRLFVSNVEQYKHVVRKLLQTLPGSASSGDSRLKFATSQADVNSTVTVYSAAQCTPDLSQKDCLKCLDGAVMELESRGWRKRGARFLFPSCFVRYEEYKFYLSPAFDFRPSFPSASPHGNERGNAKKVVILAACAGFSSIVLVVVILLVVLRKRVPRNQSTASGFRPPSPSSTTGEMDKREKVVGVLVLLLALGIHSVYKFLKRRERKKSDGAMANSSDESASVDFTESMESLLYDFGALQSATNKFSHSNKLGEGGFGSVYMGKLPSGREIAVKRLSKNSGQGILEFKNEVVLVAKLQHRNLVRLLGFCLSVNEKLLVYEYVPNKSLDYFLFDPEKKVLLDWNSRYKIIKGIARGMLYLHEDSRLRIIHRDLKPSNILLDSDMTPKISDFGMAKIFGIDQSQGNTSRIVGTYGYMAPEYAYHGEFSVKSDVYSFGVLILELVSGNRVNEFHLSGYTDYLTSYAWKKWKEDDVAEFMDPCIRRGDGATCSACEVKRCVHLGLLCVQEDIEARPTMSDVVNMLTNDSVNMPLPNNPAFYSPTGRTQTRLPVYSCNSASISEVGPR